MYAFTYSLNNYYVVKVFFRRNSPEDRTDPVSETQHVMCQYIRWKASLKSLIQSNQQFVVLTVNCWVTMVIIRGDCLGEGQQHFAEDVEFLNHEEN